MYVILCHTERSNHVPVAKCIHMLVAQSKRASLALFCEVDAEEVSSRAIYRSCLLLAKVLQCVIKAIRDRHDGLSPWGCP
jgi:hypothetical protein